MMPELDDGRPQAKPGALGKEAKQQADDQSAQCQNQAVTVLLKNAARVHRDAH